MIDMKKNEIAYHNYAEAKRTHQVKKKIIQTLQVTLCDRSKQPPSIMYTNDKRIPRSKSTARSAQTTKAFFVLKAPREGHK